MFLRKIVIVWVLMCLSVPMFARTDTQKTDTFFDFTLKDSVPQVIYDPEPGFVELYQFAWKTAYKNMKTREGMPQNPYVDEGFGASDNQNWIWDTCFMVMFCKYAYQTFPGVETLRNFYEPLHNRVKIPEFIHLADNPPLFAWAEYQNLCFTGNRAHVRQLLMKDSFLQRHFEFLEHLTKREKLPCVTNWTHWKKDSLGYFWEGGCSGMDNTVRGRPEGNEKFKPHRPNNPNMLWVDAISQQALSCYYISKLAESVDLFEIQKEYYKKYRSFADTMNRYYWDDAAGIYYDIDARNLKKLPILTPASYWPALAQIPSDSQYQRMVSLLCDSRALGTPIPWPSLAANAVDFDGETGDYWRGSVWLPMAYMGIKGLDAYGYHDLAHEHSLKILQQQLNVYRAFEPHTIWECYSPTKVCPSTEYGKLCRKDFCGWSALGPICLLIEDIVGIHSVNALKNEVSWNLYAHTGRVGVKKLRFGAIETDLISSGNGVCVITNRPYTLILNGVRYSLQSGENIISNVVYRTPKSNTNLEVKK